MEEEIKLLKTIECEYCNKENLESKPIEDKYQIETMVDDVFLYNWCKCGGHTVDRIFYCPMCGRKLIDKIFGGKL